MTSLFKILIAGLLALPLGASAAKSEVPVYDEHQTSILVTVKRPEFVIQLKSNPTTGYSWFLREYDSRYLEPVKHSYQAAENQRLIGAPGHELWAFKVKPAAFSVPQQTALRFVYARPWEKSEPSNSLVFWVSTTGNSKR